MRVFPRIRFFGHEFQWPRGSVVLFTLSLLALLITLGVWQLQRAEYKLAKAQQYRENGGAMQVDFKTLPQGLPRYSPVLTRGHFVPDPLLLLDNRTRNGRVGYQALGVFQLDSPPVGTASTATRLLVNIGWYPQGRTREALPDVALPRDEVVLQGKLDFPPDKVIRLGPDDPPREHVWVIQGLELKPLSQRLGYPLLPWLVLLDPSADFGGDRHWQPIYTVTPAKHRGYAFQWFALAFTLLILFITSNTRKVKSNDD